MLIITMILTCIFGTDNIETVEVNKTDQVIVLKDLLNITDDETKFIYNQKTYMISSILTFEKIGLTSNAELVFNNQAISG